MIKIPVLFMKDPKNPARVIDGVNPLCTWVLAGEGVATRKWDGTAVLVKEGLLYARYDAKKGKAPPPGAIPCTEAPDPVTGHWPHWVLADGAQHRWIREAHAATAKFNGKPPFDGTYEACGPSINGNAEGLPEHMLLRHGGLRIEDAPREFHGLREWLAANHCEGIVFHHPDGRMCKIRRADFGLPWPVKETT